MSPVNFFVVAENDAVAQYGIIRALDDIVNGVMRAYAGGSATADREFQSKAREAAA